MNEEQAKEIFQKALGKEPEARAAYLDRVCGGAPDLRGRVDALLRAHADAGEFLAEPERGARDEADGPGSVIGRYKLLQNIGEGGFGTVYMAEQTEPVRRTVALKILKLGMDTRQVIARFEAERQALALMDHPNIAKVFDAGATDSGRPYFVMELVRGIPITVYCDQAKLDTGARLELFQLVCGAVQHAHQKGIIHRDLKPSNILVTLHDGRPVPKVIDFGIAKAIDRPLTEKTLFTEFRQMIGTPEYMAPEQAEMSGLDVDTRADIYSLGVLLYELLTGQKPFDLGALLERGYEEMMRTIREVDPPKPSTRVSSMGAEVATVASCRHTAPKLLGRVLRGDLDWIVMKALEKDRARRYETANGLAMDIGRFLANETVLASPPGVSYRVRKFVRRHRAGVVAGTLVAAALLAGLALATYGFVEASSERDRARTEAKRANTVTALIEDLFKSWKPDSVKGANYKARELLDEFDLRFRGALHDEPEVEAHLRRVVGTAYRALGVPDKAEPHLRAAYELGRGIYGEDHEFVAENRHTWALLLNDRGDYKGAEAALRDVLRRLERLDAADAWRASVHRTLAEVLQGQSRFDEAEEVARRALELSADEEDRAAAQVTLASVLRERGRTADAEQLLRAALASRERRYGENHPSTSITLNELGVTVQARSRLDEAEALFRRAEASWEHAYGRPDDAVLRNLARLLAVRGRLEESAELCRQALESARDRLGPTHRRTAQALVDVGDIHRQRKDFVAAKAAYEEAVSILRATVGEDTLDYVEALRGLAQVHDELGDYAEAARMQRDVVRLRKRFYGERHVRVASALHNLANSLERLGRGDEALAMSREAVAMADELDDEDELSLATKLNLLGTLLERNGEDEEAERALKRSLELRTKHLGRKHEYVATVLNNLALLYDNRATRQHGRAAYLKAKRAYEEALDLLREVRGDDHLDAALMLCNLGALEASLADNEAAERHLRESLEIRRKQLGPDHPDVALVLHRLGYVARESGRFDEARQLLEEALRIRRLRLGDDHPRTRQTLCELGTLAFRLGRFGAAVTSLREALAGWEGAGQGHGEAAVDTALWLGVALECNGATGEGEALVARALADAEDRAIAARSLNTVAWTALELGRLPEAERASRAGLEYAQTVHGDDHEATADHLYTLATILNQLGRVDDAEPLVRRALAIRRARLGEENAYVVSTLTTLGAVLEAKGELDEAEDAVRRAIAIERKIGGDDSAQLPPLFNSLGTIRRTCGDLDGAERHFREGLERCRKAFGSDSVRAAVFLSNLADSRGARGDFAGAQKLLGESLELCRKEMGAAHPETLETQAHYAVALMQLGRAAEAATLLEEALPGLLAAHGPAAGVVLWTRFMLASAHHAAGDDAKAEEQLKRNVADLREHHGTDNRLWLDSARALAAVYQGSERFAEEERLRKEIVSVVRRVGGDPVDLSHALARLTSVLLERDKCAEAEAVARELVAWRDEHLPEGHWHRPSARCMLGRALAGQRKFEEAEKLFVANYDAMRPPPMAAQVKREVLAAVVAMYEAWGKPDEAEKWRKKEVPSDG